MADFDFRTKMQAPDFRLPPEVLALLSQAIQQKNQQYSQLGQSFGQLGAGVVQAHQKAKEKKQWAGSVHDLAQQNPGLAPFEGVLSQNKELAGQLLPPLIKAQNPNKQTVSVWRNTKTNDMSMQPQQGPDWMEESGLTPSQRQSALNSSLLTKARQEWVSSMKERTELQTVNNIYNDLNSLDKSSGGVLGQAAQIQYRSQRGLHLLETPGIASDKLIFNLVKADLASIAQGGSPTIAAQAEASLPTLKEEANGLLRKITADPKSINQPQIRDQMRRIFQVMDQSSGSIIDQNTQGVKTLYQNQAWVKEHPDAFKKAMQYLGQGIKPFDVTKMPALPPMPGGGSTPSWDDTAPVSE